MAKGQYNADSIIVLERLEAVRRRPGVYIGGVGSKGLNHLIYEIVDNAVGEHLVGYCDSAWVTPGADGSCTVRDNGHGIPVGMYRKGVSATRIVLSTLHAGDKFDNDAYKTGGGLHGVGSSVANVLSKHMDVEVCWGGFTHHDEYEKGKPVARPENGLLPIVGKTRKTGTGINSLPDSEVFKKIGLEAEWLESRLHETAYLNPQMTVYYKNKRAGGEEKVTYRGPKGIMAYVKELNTGKTAVHDPIYFKDTVDKIEVETTIQFVGAFEENILGFRNNIFTQEGGTHLVGFKTKSAVLINSYAKELRILKEGDTNSMGADTRNDMTVVTAIKHPDPTFEGRTKTKMASADATKAVSTVAGDELQLYFGRNVGVLKGVITCAEKLARIRRAEEKARTNMLTKSRFSFDSNGKLASYENRETEKYKIFIVGGDSAGGSTKMARNRKYRVISPIRGKILSVEKVFMDRVLANAEIETMINTFGCGFSGGYGNDFDITKLRYDKTILMMDANVDGSHADTPLFTFLYRFMLELIYDGHAYIAMSPLFKIIPKRGGEQYLYDERELECYHRIHTGGFTFQ